MDRGRGGAAGRFVRHGRGGRGGRNNNDNRKKGWQSNHPELKYCTFEDGTAEKAGQYTKSRKEIIEWIRRSDKREAEIIATAIETETPAFIAAPPAPEGEEDPVNPGQMLPADPVEVEIHRQEIALVAKRRAAVRDGMPWAFALLKGQCSPSTWGKIESEAGFDIVDQQKDAIELKRRIKAVCCGFQAHCQRMYAVAQAIVLLCTTMQENHESIDSYYTNFTSRWEMLEQFGGSLGYQTGLVADRAIQLATTAGRADEPDDADVLAAEQAIAEEMKACLMLCLANKGR
jgi:hypothetical protein